MSVKGKQPSTANYRCLSLTVNPCKVFESLMRGNMIEHLKIKVIKKCSTWLCKDKSYLTNLLVWTQIILLCLW